MTLEKYHKKHYKSTGIMLFKGKYDSIKQCCEYLKTLPLSEIIKLLQGTFMWKLIKNYYSECVKENFPVTFSNVINSANCRLTTQYFRIETGRRILSYQRFKLWDWEIPTLIKNQNAVKDFIKNSQVNLLNNTKIL